MDRQPKVKEITDEEETRNHTKNPIEEDKNMILIELLEETTWINKMNVATELAIKENDKKEEKTNEELVSKEFHKYLDIFSEEKAHRFPKPQPWDHKIEIKEGFEPKIVQKLQSHTSRTNQTRQIPQGKPGERIHKTISITNGFPIFLCQQERWKTSTLSGLSVSE